MQIQVTSASTDLAFNQLQVSQNQTHNHRQPPWQATSGQAMQLERKNVAGHAARMMLQHALQGIGVPALPSLFLFMWSCYAIQGAPSCQLTAQKWGIFSSGAHTAVVASSSLTSCHCCMPAGCCDGL